MKRRRPLKRRKPVKPVNEKRRAARRTAAFSIQAEVCRLLPCSACGYPPPSEPAHALSRGAGGKDADVVPLCGTHIRWSRAYDERADREGCHEKQHREGIRTFEARVGIDLTERARWLCGEVGRLRAKGYSAQEIATLLLDSL